MKKPELLSPVGDFECLKAAVQNGADSVYLGASLFNARANANNFHLTQLKEAIAYAKLRNVSVHLTLNTLIKNQEFEEAVNLAIDAYNMGVDAIIIQDLGLAKYLLENYPEICIHASTQMTVHNLIGVTQLEKMGISRIVLSRELSLEEIRYIRQNTAIELEMFIHGALCISYSGQCLLSSMIGGRSGNRGLCAQPCRLPYELCSSDRISIDKGYLLSPRDVCLIEYLPALIKLGIDSFKIEGRMKSPTYVGVVTKIYRKYIDFVTKNIHLDNETIRKKILSKLDEIDENTSLSDKEALLLAFNRGGFSTGHITSSPNKNLIFSEKPNHMGIYLGTVRHFNPKKGYIQLKLENSLTLGDKISINNEHYTISELMLDNQNFSKLNKDAIATIGRIKGKIFTGNKIYKIESKELSKVISPTFKEEKNWIKIPLHGKIIIKENMPITFTVWSNKGVYQDLTYTETINILPEKAINQPISEETIIKQLSKTGNTEFVFKHLEIELDPNVFIPKMSILNDVRRNALIGLEQLLKGKISHQLTQKDISSPLNHSVPSMHSNIDMKIPSITLLLNILHENYLYTNLKNIDKLYIPLKFFLSPRYEKILIELTNQFDTYIYMPHILQDSQIPLLNKLYDYYCIAIKNAKNQSNTNFSSFLPKIKGFVISHLSQIDILKKFGLELIGNFNLNVYNPYTIDTLKFFGLTCFTISPELSGPEIKKLVEHASLPAELIVYGRTPVMTNRYCYLGKSNHCYKECDKQCLSSNNLYLRDRMYYDFPVYIDHTSTITTIYNSKITSIPFKNTSVSAIRIDILEESLEDIQNILKTARNKQYFEGKNFTKGRFQT